MSVSGKKRLVFGRQLPIPAERAFLGWSKKVPELAGISDGQLTALLIASEDFQELVCPVLEGVDERNRTGYGKKVGRPSRWSALHLESVLLYRRVAGLEGIKETLERLNCDPGAHYLGFGKALPSRATLTRHMRQHFSYEQRAELYRELDRRLRQRVARLPDFDREARIMGMDGSQHGTRYTAPIPETGKTAEVVGRIMNADKQPGEPGAITAPTAGHVGGNHPKSGKGWQMLAAFTEHGTPLAWDISPLNEAETKAAGRVLESYEAEILPHRDRKTLSVLTADAGFRSNALREQLQAMTIVPNIHNASHKTDHTQPGEETENAAKRNRSWKPFKHPSKPHYENWGVNGHGELSCKCGAGQIKRDFPVAKTGDVSPTTKGQCATCGNVTITSGQWRLGTGQAFYTRCYRDDAPDPVVGNSLTFNDLLSRAYGQDRFGFGESIHATIERRFGLLQDKSWMRDIAEVKAEFAIAFSAINVLLLERDARQRASSNLTPLSVLPARPQMSQPVDLPFAA